MLFFRIFLLLALLSFKITAQPYVSVVLQGQLGNQLFQIATAYAYALDNGIPLIIPDLAQKNSYNVRYNAERLFLDKILHNTLPRDPVSWNEPSFNFSPIPKSSRLQLNGYFQSEKYFAHHRKEILELFSPPVKLREKIFATYPFLNGPEHTVGIQIRDFRQEFPAGNHHPTFGRDYYAQAMSQFPQDALYIVSTNNLAFAKECTQGLRKNLIYLESNDYIEDFYVLTFCKSFIISNSSFGWWAAWLSRSPQKRIIAPRPWFAEPYNEEMMMKDFFPSNFEIIKIKPLIGK